MKGTWGIIAESVFGGIIITFITAIIGITTVEVTITSWVLVMTLVFLIATFSCFLIILGDAFEQLLDTYPNGLVDWGGKRGYKMNVKLSANNLSLSRKWNAIKSEKEIKLAELEINEKYNRIAFLYPLGLEAFVKETNETAKLLIIHHKEAIERLDEKENERVQREKLNQDFEKIRTRYPLGTAVWLKNNLIGSTISYTQIEKAKGEKTLIAQLEEKESARIKRLEAEEKTKKELAEWKRKQNQFAEHCRDLCDDLLPEFGCYCYDIDISINRIHSDEKYIVWQLFPHSYCFEEDLDYTYLKAQKNNAVKISQNKFPFSDELVECLSKYIIKLNEEESISVYFCPPPEESQGHVYSVKYIRFAEYLDECLHDNQLYFPDLDTQDFYVDFDEWATNVKRRIIIIDIYTGNDRLKQICQKIAKKFVRKRPLLTFASMYKEFDRKEMVEIIEENKKEREEQAAFKKREVEAHRKLVNAVATWDYLANGLRYSYLFYYYPTTCDFEATDEEWCDRFRVWNFKNDPAKGISEKEHDEALDEVIPLLKERLIDTFEADNLPYLTLVCLPASTKTKNKARYKEFSKRLCEVTGMENGYEHIRFIKDGMSKNDPNNETRISIQPKIAFDDWFEDKHVLLFDDVVTKGNTMLRYKRKLENVGAVVVGGICLGKTKHTRDEE